jgi:hypothetical protein
LHPALSEDEATEALISTWRSSIKLGYRLHAAAVYGRDQELAKSVLKAVSWEFPPVTAYVTELSGLIIGRTGPDIVGLAWWWESIR